MTSDHDGVDHPVALVEHRARRDGDRADQLELRRVVGRQLGRRHGAVAALGGADRQPALAGAGRLDVAGRPHRVDDAVALAEPGEVRVELADGPEADVVGGHVDPLDAEARRRAVAAARRTRRRDAGGAVGPGDDRPAALGRLALREGEGARDGTVAVLGVAGVVHDPQRRGAVALGHLHGADQLARLTLGQRVGHDVEVVERPGERLHLGRLVGRGRGGVVVARVGVGAGIVAAARGEQRRGQDGGEQGRSADRESHAADRTSLRTAVFPNRATANRGQRLATFASCCPRFEWGGGQPRRSSATRKARSRLWRALSLGSHIVS